MRSLSQTLTEAKALISSTENWITRDYASDRQYGLSFSIQDPDATCFCALGAATRATGQTDIFNEATKALHAELPEGHTMVSLFNDDEDTTHADIMALFDRAIDKAQAQEPKT